MKHILVAAVLVIIAFWLNVPAAIVLMASMFIGGWDTGWTAYPPLSAIAPLGMQLYFVAVFFMGLSSILGAVNLITTIMTHPDLDQRLGLIVTSILLLSSFFMNRAETAIAKEDRRTFLSSMLRTAGLGVAFLVGVVLFE